MLIKRIRGGATVEIEGEEEGIFALEDLGKEDAIPISGRMRELYVRRVQLDGAY